MGILQKVIGNKALLEEKARQIETGSLRPARDLDIIRVSESIKKKYSSTNPTQSEQLSVAYTLLDRLIRDELANLNFTLTTEEIYM